MSSGSVQPAEILLVHDDAPDDRGRRGIRDIPVFVRCRGPGADGNGCHESGMTRPERPLRRPGDAPLPPLAIGQVVRWRCPSCPAPPRRVDLPDIDLLILAGVLLVGFVALLAWATC